MEATHHINWLELKGVSLALQCFVKNLNNIHILLRIDSQMAVTYVNKKGGTRSRALCDLALKLWDWCIKRSITSEHNCRLPELPPDRLERLESGSSSVQSDHQAAGKVQYRFVCQLQEHQTGPILQLETRPQIPGSGCSGPAMGGSQPIPVSSFLSDRLLFTKVEARKCSSCPPGGTSLATTGMVLNGCSKDTSARPVTGERPRGKFTPPTGAREAKAGGLAYIRQSLEKQGISEQGVELYCASWRHSTTMAYTSCWQRWIDWCGTRSTDPSKAPVGQIVAFLTDLFKEGKENFTINSYRSAISAMHSAQIGLD